MLSSEYKFLGETWWNLLLRRPGLLIPGEVPQNSEVGQQENPCAWMPFMHIKSWGNGQNVWKRKANVACSLCRTWALPKWMDPQLFFEQFAHWQRLHSTILLTTEHRGTKRARKWSQNIEGQSPMQSVCVVSWCVSLLFMMRSKGWTVNNLFRVNFIFQCSTASGAWISRHAKHQDLFFWSPCVDLVLNVKWLLRLYSCTFWQTCINLPSLLKRTCSCSYMRHI